jgi:molybdate/tungstate transport system ATP-binding protein
MTLDLDGVRKRYTGFDFGPVDLSVGNEVLAVLGPSGSGKTTLLSAIAGTVEPDTGAVSLDGRSLVGRPIEERRVGIVFQDGALFPHLTARENVDYAAVSHERAAELSRLLEIGDVLDRRPASLSGGERQRVALARTLASDPDVLLLDEPLSSLDAPIRRRLRDAFHDLFGSLDVPVVYVTHDQRDATVLGDRIAVLRDGRIEQLAPPSVVLNRPSTPFVARFTGSENVLAASVAYHDGAATELRVGSATVRTGTRVDAPVGSTVTVCVRPSRIQLCGSAGASPTNAVAGTVRRRLDEGDEYRLTVTIGGDVDVIVHARPSAVESRGITPESGVRLAIPPAAIHVLEAAEEREQPGPE